MSHIKLFAATGLLLGLAITQVYGQTNAPSAAGGAAATPANNAAGAAGVQGNAAANGAAPQANLPFNNPNALVGNPPAFPGGQQAGNLQGAVANPSVSQGAPRNGIPPVGVSANAAVNPPIANVQVGVAPNAALITPRVANERAGVAANASMFNDNRPDPWRYRHENGRWWYWAPDNRWMIYDNNQWTNYQASTVAPAVATPAPTTPATPGYTTNYGGYDNAPGYSYGTYYPYYGGYYGGWGYGGRYGGWGGYGRGYRR